MSGMCVVIDMNVSVEWRVLVVDRELYEWYVCCNRYECEC